MAQDIVRVWEREREGEQDSRRECERVGESARENNKVSISEKRTRVIFLRPCTIYGFFSMKPVSAGFLANYLML